jgi:hypothetical protein
VIWSRLGTLPQVQNRSAELTAKPAGGFYIMPKTSKQMMTMQTIKAKASFHSLTSAKRFMKADISFSSS